MTDAAIGVVFYNGVLTAVVRRGDSLYEPAQQDIKDIQEAVAAILGQCAQLRHDSPAVYVESGPAADLLCQKIRDQSEQLLYVQVVDGLDESGVRFANRRSALHHEFQKRVEEGALEVPPAFNEQLRAFVVEERNGKLFIPPPLEIAAKLGRYPAFAVAAVLAAIPAPPTMATGKSLTEFNAYDE